MAPKGKKRIKEKKKETEFSAVPLPPAQKNTLSGLRTHIGDAKPV
jgi:hypothetical protein